MSDQHPIASVLLREYLEDFKVEQGKAPEAVPTPFARLNRQCRDEGGGIGLARGWNVTIGGNTGYGKSLMALNFAVGALEAREDVGFVSLEMSDTQLATRLYAIAAGVPVVSLERGDRFSPLAVDQVLEKIRERFGFSSNLFVNREPLPDMLAIERIMDAMRREGTKFFIVDYIQLAGTGDDESIYKRVTEVSGRLRLYAKRHRVTVIGLSQYNRVTSANYSQSPTIQGLLGGSSLENDSDLVLLLDHSRYAKSDHLAHSWFLVGKNRHGGQGEIPILWDYRYLRVREGLPDELHEWPEHQKRTRAA